MICIDFKFLNLYYIIKKMFPTEPYIKFNPEFGIKIITKDVELYKKISELDYFKNNNFFIKTYTYDFSPNIFFITMLTSISKDFKLNKIFEDFYDIYNKFKCNIHLINEEGFLIEENDIMIINEIYDKISEFYNYTRIENKHIFLIK